jgi:hypothetical protein
MRIPMYFVAICATFLFSCCKKTIEPASCLPTNLQNGVIAFYPFSNSSLKDFVNNHNLTNTTTAKPSSDRSGNLKCAFEFKNLPSGNEFLHIKNPIFLDNISELSISLWYMPLDTNRCSGSYEGLAQRDSCITCHKRGQWSLGLYDCRRATFGMNNSAIWDSYKDIEDCTPTYYANKWHHLVVTFKNNKVQLFRNGVSTTDLSSNFDGTNCPYINNFGDLFIGKGFTGVIDDVILYNRELTVAEVKQLQNLPACCE